MKYAEVIPAVFLDRPNRFIAHAEIDGRLETVHVKNTGRCKELLIPGCEVYLSKAKNPARKTAWDLVAVRKSNGLLINIDSQAPNTVVREWLFDQGFDVVRPEYPYGDSRIDFYLARGEETILMEVKGCTLEIGGVGYFPDAPTERGIKHLRELTRSVQEGYRAILAFVIQMDGITEVRANIETHAAFGAALEEAKSAGVEVLYLPCHVEPDVLRIIEMDRIDALANGSPGLTEACL